MKSNHRYLPISNAQRAWGLYATCAGHSQTEPGDEFPASSHPDEYFFTWEAGRILHEWQFILIERGQGTVEFKNRRCSAKEGSLVILPPECWHRYRPNRKTGWTTLWIGFGGELASRLIGGIGFNPSGEVRDITRQRKSLHLFSGTVEEIIGHGSDNTYSTAARILALAASLSDESSASADGVSDAALINRAQNHIIEHVTEIIDFAALAATLNVPYRTLRYIFTKATGTSLLQYQLNIRLTRAKNLLRSTEMPVAEIAKVLGFNSAWYFSHFFQQRTRTSAAAYRKKYRLMD